MRVLVTGAGGQLGAEVVRELAARAAARRRGPALEVVGASHEQLDVARRDEVVACIAQLEPDVVINAAALTAVDRCETEPDLAFAVNALGARHVAEGARLVGAHVVYVSTDYVFDGTKAEPYDEWDAPNPLSVYGRSKLGGELESGDRATIVRTSWVCGRTGTNMVRTVLRLLEERRPLRFVDDQVGSPTVAADLAARVVDLALARRAGRFHVTNQGATSWYGLVRAVVGFAGGDPERVEPIRTEELDPPRAAPRPKNSVLDNRALRLEGLPLLPGWESSISKLVQALRA